MINQQLLDYIKQQLAQNVSKEIIINNLLLQGWQQQNVAEAFSVVESLSVVISPTSPNPNQTTPMEAKMKKTTRIINIIEVIFLPVSVVVSFLFQIALVAPGYKKDLITKLAFWGIIYFPIILIVSLILSRIYYNKRRYILSFWTSFIFAIPGILGISIWIFASIMELSK